MPLIFRTIAGVITSMLDVVTTTRFSQTLLNYVIMFCFYIISFKVSKYGKEITHNFFSCILRKGKNEIYFGT